MYLLKTKARAHSISVQKSFPLWVHQVNFFFTHDFNCPIPQISAFQYYALRGQLLSARRDKGCRQYQGMMEDDAMQLWWGLLMMDGFSYNWSDGGGV